MCVCVCLCVIFRSVVYIHVCLSLFKTLYIYMLQGDRERSPNSISDWLNLSALPTVGGIFTADEWHDDLSACVKVNSIVSERALQQ